VDPSDFKVRYLCKLGFEVRLYLPGALGPPGKLHTRALVDSDDSDIRQRLPVLVFKIRIGERNEKAGESKSAERQSPAASPSGQPKNQEAHEKARDKQLAREEREELDGPVHDELCCMGFAVNARAVRE
jgi:hypothetical protein